MHTRLTQIGSGLVVAVIMALSACNPAPTPNAATTTAAGLPAIGWDKNPNAIIFRLDRTLNGEAQVAALNRLPLCTLYGSGHLVWVNATPPDGEQVLETQLDDPAIRAFLDFVIKQQHFYSIPDYAANQLPPSGSYITESAVLNLTGAVRTLRSYSHWPNNEFQIMLDTCTHLTKQPVLYVPTGAWLSVFPLTGDVVDPPILWSDALPFRLAAQAASGKPIWVSGDLLATFWSQIRRTLGAIRWQENDKNYKIVLQVPNISRDSPAAPDMTPTPLPSTVPTGRPTTVPTLGKPTSGPTGLPGS